MFVWNLTESNLLSCLRAPLHSCTTSHLLSDCQCSLCLPPVRRRQLGKVTATFSLRQEIVHFLTKFNVLPALPAVPGSLPRKRVQSYTLFPDPPNFLPTKCALKHRFNICSQLTKLRQNRKRLSFLQLTLQRAFYRKNCQIRAIKNKML